MVVYNRLKDIQPLPNSVLTMGTFDGLHRGHQEIVKKVTTIAQSRQTLSVLITFDPHPRHVLESSVPLPMLMSIEKKLEVLEHLAVDQVVVIPFTRRFSRISATRFLDEIVLSKFRPLHIVVGYNHHFGHDREGDAKFLEAYGRKQGFTVGVVPPVRDENMSISSTHIRELIAAGFVRRASFELGWVYGFKARVVRGAGRGKDLHFPTANFIPLEKNQLLPHGGVYLTRGRIDGNNLYGMCNLGFRPTFGEDDFVMEVHFFEKDLDDLYGREIEVEFLERIRDEQKFVDSQHLQHQLEQDQATCLELLQKYN